MICHLTRSIIWGSFQIEFTLDGIFQVWVHHDDEGFQPRCSSFLSNSQIILKNPSSFWSLTYWLYINVDVHCKIELEVNVKGPTPFRSEDAPKGLKRQAGDTTRPPGIFDSSPPSSCECWWMPWWPQLWNISLWSFYSHMPRPQQPEVFSCFGTCKKSRNGHHVCPVGTENLSSFLDLRVVLKLTQTHCRWSIYNKASTNLEFYRSPFEFASFCCPSQQTSCSSLSRCGQRNLSTVGFRVLFENRSVRSMALTPTIYMSHCGVVSWNWKMWRCGQRVSGSWPTPSIETRQLTNHSGHLRGEC